jgi:hypothetical protein
VWLVAAAAVLAAAGVFVLVDDQRVGVGGSQIVLPGTCVSRYVFGFPCPACGLTRSFVALAHGEPARAFAFNPAGVLLFALVALQLPWRAAQIWRIRAGLPEWDETWLHWAVILTAIALVLQWIVRLAAPGWVVF